MKYIFVIILILICIMLKIKELRTSKNESQTTLSKVVGVSLRTIQNYEAGKVSVPKDKLEIIAKHYNVTISYLFGESTTNKMPLLRKEGVEISIKEMLVFMIENEDELKQDKQFSRYIREIGREATMKYLIENNLIKK